ncbi:hypothetical protein SAMD00019534_060620, partial [Acytostelium subglobosum LB1]|uniref:hypothetical protein n=1 Tax=Acytostelium subglobosum LB1 TaxID=1410327 RepID=UPI0006448AA7
MSSQLLAPIKIEGYLTKQGGSFKSWSKRWFILRKGELSYYKSKSDTSEPKGTIPLKTVGFIRISEKKKKHVFEIHTAGRTILVMADNDESRNRWIEVLTRERDLIINADTIKKPAKLTVDDFELLKLVGKGSFGKVLQVRKKDTNDIYAMKVLSKNQIVENDEVIHTISERVVLQKISHPFLVNLHYSFQTEDKLYLILDYINGGELFYHLRKEKRFGEERVRFYCAEILLALEHLHLSGVIYRDLKPENLLVTKDGHICMTDFGLCKEGFITSKDKTKTFCGTPEYLAPEVVLSKSYGKPVDWWAYGSLMFEMLTGMPPFFSENTKEMYNKILHERLVFPSAMSSDARSLIDELLERDPSKRLCNPTKIKRHPFFKSIDWESLYHKKVAPPYIPRVKDKLDTTQIDPTFTEEVPTLTISGEYEVQDIPQKDFEGFSFVADSYLVSPPTTSP